jgi:Protein of unknown function (DUF3102)
MPEHGLNRLAYDYPGVDPQIRERVEKEEVEICQNLITAKHAAIKIGERLLQVKQLLPHGHFGRWVRARCDFTEHTASNFMNAAAFAARHKKLTKISQTGLFLLAAPRLDENIRQRVIEAVEAGSVRSTTEIRALIHKETVATASPAYRSEKTNDADNVGAPIIEFASILIGALSQADLDRVVSIVSTAAGTFDQLADALRANLPVDPSESMRPDGEVT